MIQIDEVHIEELRGIKKLTLPIGRKSFAIHGPNGSGKSGIVDAIEFALTGDMTRLSGKGTAGLSVKSHGPHVDTKDHPDKALVRIKVYLPSLNKTVVATRTVKAPNKLILVPDDPAARMVLAEVAAHPEITLTRRQIIRLILTEAGNRSKDVQSLLRLDGIETTRASLRTAANRVNVAHASAAATRELAAEALTRHLNIDKLDAESIVRVVNAHRKVLGLQDLTHLAATTSLIETAVEENQESPKVDREAALRNLKSLTEELAAPMKADDDLDKLRRSLSRLKDDPELFVALQRRAFLATGLSYVTDESCPLCDTEWDAEVLRSHLQAKLQISEQAQVLDTAIDHSATLLQERTEAIRSLVRPVADSARMLNLESAASELERWLDNLLEFKTQLETLEGAIAVSSRIDSDWRAVPADIGAELGKVEHAIQALPERSAETRATSFLAVAQERLEAFRESKRNVEQRKRSSDIAESVYRAYCDASSAVLTRLYEDVEKRFSEWYAALNRDDESSFAAQLSPGDGKLDLAVDFHERGLFHPGAYHSEGHQDGMGLCLYLALMRQLLGSDFRLAVLDDVVMSVDRQHRKEICALLRKEFPNTQFLITTHDETWLNQMRSARLVEGASCVNFRSWTIEQGPRVQAAQDAWEEIAAELEAGRVNVAAAVLRRYLEFVSGEVCVAIGGRVVLKLDCSYDLGDLMNAIIERLGNLLTKAENAAKSWGQTDVVAAAKAARERFNIKKQETNVEQWAINKAVHYNEWANFEKADFEPVVVAFREFMECFKCDKCGAWLEAQPRSGAKKLACMCNAISFGLVAKS